jgi:cyclophilin family peptidyl-prolyl cis-trans isomerase
MFRVIGLLFAVSFSVGAAPIIDPIPSASVPRGKSLIIPVTASSPNGRPLTFTATSTTNRIKVEVHTNNPFWKMSVVQVAPSNTPGAFEIPFRNGTATVTNIGDLTFMLFRDIAPHAVDVIQGLTAAGFYTSNTIFHRVVPGFVIQGGDPLTNGLGGPVFRFDNEFNPRALFAGNGQLALANSGKDTDGSQFFVTIGRQRFLDLGYTLFGQLVRGFNVLTNVGTVATNGDSRPFADVIITKASIVPDPFDTVLTLVASNLVGASGTIRVVADDGAGGRTTNSFSATIVTDTNNAPPILYPLNVTNLVGAVNTRLTNVLTALDLNGDPFFWFPQFADESSFLNASNSSFNSANGRLVIIPNANYVGPIRFLITVSSASNWDFLSQFLPPSQWPPYDWQLYTFAFGDTRITGTNVNFAAAPLVPFTNEVLTTFTNGVPGSPTSAFTATINWGDNSISSGVITSNVNGRKEVRGSHTYTNAGNYPVNVTIQSTPGARRLVGSTISVRPNLSLTLSGTNRVIRWPAWAMDYQLQSHTNLLTTNWVSVTNLPVLNGYDLAVTNRATSSNSFYRLRK